VVLKFWLFAHLEIMIAKTAFFSKEYWVTLTALENNQYV
jgi:hypothetical protein